MLIGKMPAAAALAALFAASLAGCQSSDMLQSAASSSSPAIEASMVPPAQEPAVRDSTGRDQQVAADTLPGVEAGPAIPETASSLPVPQPAPDTANGQLAALAPDPDAAAAIPGMTDRASVPVVEVQKPRTNKTYLINGLLSAVPFIGYGFRNLKEKMPEAELYSYMGIVEGPAVIAPKIIREVEEAWRADPDVSVNLIGISLGADLITVIANKLDEKGIPVNYLGIVDGTSLQPIPDNVAKADNLTCTNLDCTRAKARLRQGNNVTVLSEKRFRSSHIPLGGNKELHERVIAQSRS